MTYSNLSISYLSAFKSYYGPHKIKFYMHVKIPRSKCPTFIEIFDAFAILFL